MPSHCMKCEEEDHLVPCNVCMGWVCRKHRVGTGSVNDGYTCMEHWGPVSPAQPAEVKYKHKHTALVELIISVALGGIVLIVYGAYQLYRLLQPLIEVTHH
jgi:hypothetical protein